MKIYAVVVSYDHPDGEGYGTEYENVKMGYFSTYEKAEECFNNAASKEAQRIVDDTVYENEDVQLMIASYELDECFDVYGAQGTMEKGLEFHVSELQQKFDQLVNEYKYDTKEYEETLAQLNELHGVSFEDEAE